MSLSYYTSTNTPAVVQVKPFHRRNQAFRDLAFFEAAYTFSWLACWVAPTPAPRIDRIRHLRTPLGSKTKLLLEDWISGINPDFTAVSGFRK